MQQQTSPQSAPAIISDPAIMLGKPVISGTRITVELILRYLAEGLTVDDILKQHRHLTREGVQAAIHHAWELVNQEAEEAAKRRMIQGNIQP